MDLQKNYMHSDITEIILGCCFDVINELGCGFLESVYKKALLIALNEKNLKVELEKKFEIKFRNKIIGYYYADIVVENCVIVELKCCEKTAPEHQAQVINYLKASDLQVGLLVNFGKPKLEFKRLHHPNYHVNPAGTDQLYPEKIARPNAYMP